MNKFLRVLGAIAAVITSIVYFVLLTAFSFALNFTNVINKDNLKDLTRSIDILEFPIGGIISDQEENGFKDEETVKDFLGDVLENAGLTSNEAESILNNEEINDVLNDFIYSIIEYNIYGEEKTPSLDSAKVLDAIDSAGINLNNEGKEAVEKIITDINENISNELKLDEKAQNNSTFISYSEDVQFGLSIVNSIWFKLMLGTAFIFTFLLIALYRWSFYKPLIWLGVPTIISGALTTFVGSLKLLSSKIDIEVLGEYQSIFKNMIDPILNNLLITGLIILASGILMVVGYSIVDNIKHKKEEPKLD